MAVNKKSEIKFTVTLDENNVPEEIKWEAEGSGSENANQAKAIMLALYDEKEQNTLRIDLWTKDLVVEEMKKFTCQNIITLADSFARATAEDKYADEIREFGKNIAIRMGVLEPKK